MSNDTVVCAVCARPMPHPPATTLTMAARRPGGQAQKYVETHYPFCSTRHALAWLETKEKEWSLAS